MTLDPMFPNGRCDVCGNGLSDEGACQDVTCQEGPDVGSLLESAPECVANVASLYSWSLNYDSGKGPFVLFLDLIGYSEDEYGETLYSLRDASLGYRELSELSDALSDYVNAPADVREFVAALMAAESRD